MELKNINLHRKLNLAKITGPIPLISLILASCEFILAWSLINVSIERLQWFIAISMVSLLAFTIICFFILIFFFKEHAYSPDSYPDDVIRKLFTTNKKNKSENNSNDIKLEVMELIDLNGNVNYSDFIADAAIEFNSTENKIRDAIFTLQKEGKIELVENEALDCMFISKK